MFNFLRVEARWLLAGFLLTLASSFGQTYFISLSNTDLMERFGLNHGGIGLVYALATTASAIILLEFGRIVDRVTTRTAAIITACGLAAACLLMAMVQAVWMLFFAFLALRLFGQGMMSQVAMTATGRWFEARRGRAISIVSLGYAAGIASTPALAVTVMAMFGYRQLWILAAAVMLLVAVPVLFVLLSHERVPSGVASTPDADMQSEKRSWRRAQVLRSPAFWILLAGVLCPSFMLTSLLFHQLHLMDVKHWDSANYAATFSVFALVQVASSLLCGGLIDRFSAHRLLPVYLVPMALALIGVSQVDGFWIVLPMMILIGITAGFDGAIAGALWPELFGPKFLGEIRALTFAIVVGASAVSPLVTGYLIDLGIGFPLQLLFMGAYTLAASALMLALQPQLSAIAIERVPVPHT
ncbi:MFS transporter [Hyphomonas johnsonii]|uniref:Major facilitator superfamily transporter n=1 Tax=Hyphomonas johnsonii MHS-2 TaxID=1280950 RepID=A0A059FE20_9PROT|nr:MFS transporter [Hyphomonas johnsonii]KCZ88885.1 major facilitator superfamily transporter [Hyphomonas johnsonii MHS-2]